MGPALTSNPMNSKQNFETLQVTIDDQGICVCTFNRPEARNALNHLMVREIHRLLHDLRHNVDKTTEVRAVIFTGAGDQAFVSGADIAELKERTHQDALQQINSRLFREIENFPVPTIAAIRGFALGGGMELALACDLRICGRSASFGQPEVSLGIIPAAGACYRLPKLIGIGRAKELILTGRIIAAPEALAMGLVNGIADDDDVLDAAHELARAVIKNSAIALRMAKATINATANITTDIGMSLESNAQAVLFDDDEKMRRMSAFLERRKSKKEKS